MFGKACLLGFNILLANYLINAFTLRYTWLALPALLYSLCHLIIFVTEHTENDYKSVSHLFLVVLRIFLFL